ncbi:hypothetical protein NUSPORA_00466 [Nucleospora cyclopteri]
MRILKIFLYWEIGVSYTNSYLYCSLVKNKKFCNSVKFICYNKVILELLNFSTIFIINLDIKQRNYTPYRFLIELFFEIYIMFRKIH